jgi:copper homeostasis protein
MSTRVLEIAANSVASALAAQDGGADRIELCENLGEGGCSPSHGSIAVARERLRIPVYVLVRPRAGDFVYDAIERETMLRDIEACVRLGCDGVVLGALDAGGDVDIDMCRGLIAAAGGLGVTFHRAFDCARDRSAALESVIALGCERVLTSGGKASAPEGADVIAALVRQAGTRIGVMAGAGVNAGNVRELVARTGTTQFHASARVLRDSQAATHANAVPGLPTAHFQTEAAQVRALKERLQG